MCVPIQIETVRAELMHGNDGSAQCAIARWTRAPSQHACVTRRWPLDTDRWSRGGTRASAWIARKAFIVRLRFDNQVSTGI